MQEINIQDFLNKELVNYASYDNLRKIGSCIDGLKNASRKVMFTIHEKKIKEKVKVSQLSAKCAEYSDYLHGDTLWNVLVTLGKDYAGTNNIPLIKKFGNFGTRCINESSAPRYIFAKGSDEFFKYFMYEDDPILEQQYFEGNRIEPRFYVPTLPFLLVNGSEGVSSGFAQKILPRYPENLKTYILNSINGKENDDSLLYPWVKGFEGDFYKDPEVEGRWYFTGKVEHIQHYEYLITEVPFTYDLKSYTKVLEDLEDSGVINKFQNVSDGENKIQFKVWIPKGVDTSNEALLDRLKLIKVMTENYTCIDENNKIIEFSTARQIIDHYIEIKLEYLQKRKDYILTSFENDLKWLSFKIKFLTLFIENKINIVKVPIVQIIKQLEDFGFEKYEDSYNYLLSMPISSLTMEKLDSLNKEYSNLSDKKSKLEKTSIAQLWKNDLK